MDLALFEALRSGKKAVHLATVELPGYTIRWMLETGFVNFDGQIYRKLDPLFGTLDEIGEIKDGVDDDSSPVELTISPPDLASLEDLAGADAQGGKVQIHLGAISEETGLLVGTPYRLHVGFLDRPVWSPGDHTLAYDVLTAEALALEPNEEQRQSDAFHQYVWPGERGYEYQTDGTKIVYWRDDDPNNAIGYRSSRKKKGGDPKEFTYDPDAAWAFPFGRCQVSGVLNFRVGFGPTNRFNSIVATLAASGPIQGIVSVTVGDEMTTFGANDVATNGDHSGALWVQRKLGTQPQAALTFPTGLPVAGQPPVGWTADHKQSGKAVFLATMYENSKKSEWQGGVPNFEIVYNGLKGWDPTVGTSLISDTSTWVYLETGPMSALNWSIGRWEGAVGDGRYGVPYLSKLVGGYGAAIDAIDVAAYVAAHSVAVAYGWKVSEVPTSADDKYDVRKRLLQSAGCEPATICGLISVVCSAAPVASEMVVANRDTSGRPQIAIGRSRLERRNVALPKFKSEANRWEMAQIGAVGNPDWITQDRGRRASGPSYSTVPDKDQCAALAYLDLAHDRALVGEAQFFAHMMRVEPGKAFTWQEPEFRMVDLKVQVRTRSYDPMKAMVRTVFRAERDEDYVEAGLVTGVAPPPSVPGTPPVRYGTARMPSYRTTLDGSQPVAFTTQTTPGATDTSIDIVAHKAWFSDSPPVSFAAGTVSGLAPATAYGIFGNESGVYEAEASPALAHQSDPNWILIGFQSTANVGGTFPDNPTPPGGWGGDTPLYAEP